MRDRLRLARQTCRRWPATALAGALLLASPAAAQDDNSGALGFLKPWLERELFGRETSSPPAASDAPPAPEAPAPTEDEAAPDPAAAPASEATDGSNPSDSDSQSATSPPETETDEDIGGTDLRGSESVPDDAAAEPSASPPDAATADPDSEAPGVPVEAKPETLRLAVLAGRSVSATMAAVGPVADALQEILGRPVEILPLTSYDAMVDAQTQRRIDGGFYSATAFAAADTSCACLEPIVAPRASDGTLAYHAIIVARSGAGIASIADLAGKVVAVGAADSLGARRLQLAGLLSEGVDPAALGSVLEVDSAAAAVRLVAAGMADAAFAWSSMEGGASSGYSRGTLTDLAAAGEIAMDNLAVVWASPPVTHGPFAVLRTLPEADKARIGSYLAALSAGNPAAYDVLDPLYGGGYAPVAARDYSGLETLLGENVDALNLPLGPSTTGATPAAEAAPDVPSAPN